MLINYKAALLGYFFIVAVVIYLDSSQWKEKEPISVCCNAKVKFHYEKHWCMDCKLFCEVKI